MKRPITPAYTFAPGSGTLNLSGIAGFDIRSLFAVIDLKTGALVYAPMAGYGFSALSGTTLTLQAPMTGLSGSDPLLILYDDGGKPAEDATVQAVVSALGTLNGELAANHTDLTTLHADLASILADLNTGLANDTTALAAISTTATWQANLLAATGAPGDAAASADTGSFSLAALAKRALARWTALLGLLPASLGAKAGSASFPVVLASDQPALANPTSLRQTGTLAALNDAVTLAVDGMNTVVVQLAAGSWGGGPAVFEGSADNATTWTAVNMLLYAGSAPTGSTTAGGLWEMACGGLTHLRVRASATITGGPVAAVVAAMNGLKSVRVGNPAANPLTVTTGRTAAAGDAIITNGGTAQTLFSGATPANGWKIANPDPAEDLWVSDSATAAPNSQGSYKLPAGGILTTEPGERPCGPVSVYGATTGHVITARSW